MAPDWRDSHQPYTYKQPYVEKPVQRFLKTEAPLLEGLAPLLTNPPETQHHTESLRKTCSLTVTYQCTSLLCSVYNIVIALNDCHIEAKHIIEN